MSITPDFIVGDFDSVSKELLEQYSHIPQEKHSPNKNELDLELAINVVKVKGAKEFLLLGALGDRIDQSLAAILIATRLKKEGFICSLHSGKQDIYPIIAEEELKLSIPLTTTFSLLSMEQTSRLSVTNAKYPLNNFPLEFGVGLGVSNYVTTSPLIIKVSYGSVICVLEREISV